MSKPLNGCVRSHASNPSSSPFDPASHFAEYQCTSISASAEARYLKERGGLSDEE